MRYSKPAIALGAESFHLVRGNGNDKTNGTCIDSDHGVDTNSSQGAYEVDE